MDHIVANLQNHFCCISECTCQTMTISLSGAVLSSEQSGRAGDYQESVIVNGHPSWINANHAIWFVDEFDDWGVGGIEKLGTRFAGLLANNQGGLVCPFDITFPNWNFWNGNAGWTSAGAGEISITCSQTKGKNNNYINITV